MTGPLTHQPPFFSLVGVPSVELKQHQRTPVALLVVNSSKVCKKALKNHADHC